MPPRSVRPLLLVLLGLAACAEERTPPNDPADGAAANEATAPDEAPDAAPEAALTAVVPSASGDHPEPCPWLPTEAATAVLGDPVTVTRPAGYTSPCHIESSPFTWAGTLMVQEGDALDAAASTRGLTPEHLLDAAASTRGLTLEPLEGLGERAGWVTTTEEIENNGNGEVLVEQGGRVFSVSLRSSPGSGVREKAQALARAVVEALPAP